MEINDKYYFLHSSLQKIGPSLSSYKHVTYIRIIRTADIMYLYKFVLNLSLIVTILTLLDVQTVWVFVYTICTYSGSPTIWSVGECGLNNTVWSWTKIRSVYDWTPSDRSHYRRVCLVLLNGQRAAYYVYAKHQNTSQISGHKIWKTIHCQYSIESVQS